jgi:hypothetical protein
MPTKTSSTKRTRAVVEKSDRATSYDDFKEHEGTRYTGMKIGRAHKWYYDQGEWKEKKVTPDLWEISYAVTKRRAGRAPEGSGVPVGTEYHWYVLAHQNVRKLNANDYTTSLSGLKFKIAHRRADTEKWSATPKTQRRRMIAFLRGVIADLEKDRPAEVRTTARSTTGKRKPPSAKRAATGKPKTPPSMLKRGWKTRAKSRRR